MINENAVRQRSRSGDFRNPCEKRRNYGNRLETLVFYNKAKAYEQIFVTVLKPGGLAYICSVLVYTYSIFAVTLFYCSFPSYFPIILHYIVQAPSDYSNGALSSSVPAWLKSIYLFASINL